MVGVLLLDYNAVEGAGAVSTRWLYIEAAGSEADEKSWQRMAVPVYPHRWPPQRQGWGLLRQLAGALLLDYDIGEGTGAVPPCRQYIKAAGSEGDEEVGRG